MKGDETLSDSQLAASIPLSAGYVLANGVWQKINRIVKGTRKLTGSLDGLSQAERTMVDIHPSVTPPADSRKLKITM